jgi:hypothetical protein
MYDNHQQRPRYKDMATVPSKEPSFWSTLAYAFVFFAMLGLGLALWLSVAPANMY